ncbi:MAG: glycosyltransferase family 4 protein [Candidatus Omnitrophota bacterium]
MKILHLVNHLNIGGITTYIRTLAGEQVKAGHEVFVWGEHGTQSDDFRALGCTVLGDVPRCKSELSPRLWFALPKLLHALKTHSIDIVHTHTRVTQVLAGVATFFAGVPYVSTAHMFYKRRLGRRFFPCWGKTIIAISTVMEEGLRTIFKEKELPPITVVPNGIDVEHLRGKFDSVDRVKIRKDYGYCDQDLVVLSLSRLIPVKGVHILIEAFAAAHKEVSGLKLLVAGAGDSVYTQGLKDRVRELHLEKDVLFLGNEPAIEKPFQAGDIFAAPYLWPEAFGLSVLEAMTVGLPVAGSISGGIVDLLGHGKYGLLFVREDVSDLTSCLLRYAKDPSLRAKMGAAARKAALEYSSVRMCERVQKVYDQVLKERA